MRVKTEQLAAHLRGELAPVYLVFGEEPLLIEETADLVRAQARSKGFSERQILPVERGFDWGRLQLAADGLSLFASRRLIELRMPGNTPGEQGARVLKAYAENLAPDTLLLIISGKWDRRVQKTQWFLALERTGVAVQTFKVDQLALPQWLERRMRVQGLQPTPEAVAALTERLEGNLLACAQEIDKLVLLYPEGVIDAEKVWETIADNARYDAFRLMESVLAGDVAQVPRILRGLRAEGAEIMMILGAIAWELRRLAPIAYACARGSSVDQVLREQRVWDKRKVLIKCALRRHSARRWYIFLQRLGDIDRMAKGVAKGCPWEAVLQLCLAIAGAELFPPRDNGGLVP